MFTVLSFIAAIIQILIALSSLILKIVVVYEENEDKKKKLIEVIKILKDNSFLKILDYFLKKSN